VRSGAHEIVQKRTKLDVRCRAADPRCQRL